MSLYLLCLAIGAIGLVAMALTGLGRHGQPHHAAGVRATATAWLWNLTSPRLLFSVLIGFGTTGLLLRGVLVEPLAFGAALAGGVLFERGIVGPVWNFLLRFA